MLSGLARDGGLYLPETIPVMSHGDIAALAGLSYEEIAFRVMYLAIRHFKQQGSGHLVNTSSVLGTKVRPNIGAYAGTKHAVEALAEALRLEVVGSGIRVTCVEPGLVATDLHRDFDEPPSKMQGIDEPLKPEDVARSVMFALEQPSHVLIPRVLILPREQPM